MARTTVNGCEQHKVLLANVEVLTGNGDVLEKGHLNLVSGNQAQGWASPGELVDVVISAQTVDGWESGRIVRVWVLTGLSQDEHGGVQGRVGGKTCLGIIRVFVPMGQCTVWIVNCDSSVRSPGAIIWVALVKLEVAIVPAKNDTIVANVD